MDPPRHFFDVEKPSYAGLFAIQPQVIIISIESSAAAWNARRTHQEIDGAGSVSWALRQLASVRPYYYHEPMTRCAPMLTLDDEASPRQAAKSRSGTSKEKIQRAKYQARYRASVQVGQAHLDASR